VFFLFFPTRWPEYPCLGFLPDIRKCLELWIWTSQCKSLKIVNDGMWTCKCHWFTSFKPYVGRLLFFIFSYFSYIRLIAYKLLCITKRDLHPSSHQPTCNILLPLDRFLSNFLWDFSVNSVNQIQTDIVHEHHIFISSLSSWFEHKKCEIKTSEPRSQGNSLQPAQAHL
jgi:hypothetical protein